MKTIEIKTVIRDGKELTKLLCPDCLVWGEVDQDQINGLVSIHCECGFHETHNILKRIEDAAVSRETLV